MYLITMMDLMIVGAMIVFTGVVIFLALVLLDCLYGDKDGHK